MVTGRGDVLSTTPDGEDAGLFHAVPGAYGSLGLVTAAWVPVVAGERHVAMEYRLFGRAEELVAYMEGAAAAGFDYMEGIGFGPGCFVACGGRFAGEEEAASGRLGDAAMPMTPCWLWTRGKPCVTRMATRLRPVSRAVPALASAHRGASAAYGPHGCLRGRVAPARPSGRTGAADACGPAAQARVTAGWRHGDGGV